MPSRSKQADTTAVDVLVVGGGAVGLGVAYELHRAGADVAVIDEGRVGGGASHGNAGWITPALCAVPIPGPGVIPQAIRWMARPDSPFLLRPRIDAAFAMWLWRFVRASSASSFTRAMRALIAHNRDATAALASWHDQGVPFELHRTGLLFAGTTEKALDHEWQSYRRLRDEGFDVALERLSRRDIAREEPAISEKVLGGLLSSDEWHVRPETLTAGLARRLGEGDAQLYEGVSVRRIFEREAAWKVETSIGTYSAKRVVVAAGVATRNLLAPLGYALPLEAAKGYSITGQGDGTSPRRAVYMLEAKVGCSPYTDSVRVAGTLELGARDMAVNDIRVAAIRRAAEKYLHWRSVQSDVVWAGARPLTPDGLPVIGPVPGLDGLFVSTGHAMAGITLAAVSAQLLAPVVLGGELPEALRGVSPDRFS